jgi:pimeloyl-ACP methyl ester carboxylesterase
METMISKYLPPHLMEQLPADVETLYAQTQRVLKSGLHHQKKINDTHSERSMQLASAVVASQEKIGDALRSGQWLALATAYGLDALQRLALTADVLRQRGNNDKAHEAAGTPPVLDYEYEVVVDGAHLTRPVNYQLLKILPAKGVKVSANKRPFMIIDPRAGHGAGIGGFKPDSQVGVALRAGHPVYFVVFRQYPEIGQTIADVMHAEAEFLRQIAAIHPHAGLPIVVGNCQGGWATLLLSACNPELTGPLVINGAPVSTWSGQVGENPMRYNGGLLGGVVPALLISDLGDGKFDGAHLVSNFEMLNPSRNFFGKYYDLFTDPEKNQKSFLEFERWWGGYHFTNEAEIHWIIEQLFIGNRLARGQAQLEPGLPIDLKAIRAPIIVFASRGDNITPPQQALNWIVDTFTDEHEIRVRGQRIIYMVHDKVGHLGIFVSSSIARKEHAEMTSTLKTIEALAPGLYEMKIDETAGDEGNEHFYVSFHGRTMADILSTVPNDREQERDFAAVARLSELGSTLYDMTLRPVLKNMVTPASADALRDAHPSRVSRKLFSDNNPAMPLLQAWTAWAKDQRQPTDASNPFLEMEQLLASGISQSMDMLRDLRDANYEATFLSIYGAPYLRQLGETHAKDRVHMDPEQLRHLPEVRKILAGMNHGDIAAAVVRMLILLAGSRGSVRRDRLERSAEILTESEPFKAMGSERRATLIHEQSVIVEFEHELSVSGLPSLLHTDSERSKALDMVRYIIGAREEMEPHSQALLERMESLMRTSSTQVTQAPAKKKPASRKAASGKPSAQS